MRKAILFSLLLFLVFPSLNSAQKRRRSQAKPRASSPFPGYTPCGVYYSSWEDFGSDIKDEWRRIAGTNDAVFYYNPREELCDTETGVLRAWIKVIPDSSYTAGYSQALHRYELKCRKEQLRVTEVTRYKSDGVLLGTVSSKYVEWDEALPESIGRAILDRVCRNKQ